MEKGLRITGAVAGAAGAVGLGYAAVNAVDTDQATGKTQRSWVKTLGYGTAAITSAAASVAALALNKGHFKG